MPTPRGGGLALVIGALAATVTSSHLVGPPRTALVLVTLGLGGLGFTEDLYGVPAKTRLLAQLGMGVVVLPSLAYSMGGSNLWQIVFAAGAVAWIAAYVNAFNFMDGINGISAAQAFFAGVAWWLIGERAGVGELAAIGAVAAGVALAFLPVNFPKAAVFLGDVGSYFLGGWLAVGVVLGIRAGVAPVGVLSPMALYLADTSVTIVQRYRRGEAILEAHRSHAYQRLVALGWSHMHAVLVVSAGIVTCAAAGYWALDGGRGRHMMATAIIMAVVAVYLCLPADVARRHRKRERLAAHREARTGSSVVA
ncbi:MAG: glycosyl transferase [Acidimicrobiia bacterium]